MRFGATEQELLAEKLHYTILQNLVPNNDFNAIKYLYDRLNIVDAKAQGLLTRNGLLLTTVSIIASTQIGKDWDILYSRWWLILFAVAYLLLVAATLATVNLTRLRFDNVTVLPAAAEAVLLKNCTCRELGRTPCAERPICRYQEVLQTVEGLRAADGNAGPLHARSGRTLTEYEDLFFKITIERQKLLQVARICTICATVLFFIVIGAIFLQAAFLPPPGS